VPGISLCRKDFGNQDPLQTAPWLSHKNARKSRSTSVEVLPDLPPISSNTDSSGVLILTVGQCQHGGTGSDQLNMTFFGPQTSWSQKIATFLFA